jgi:UTP--glucose-1-phosphate uridylyltransferase
VLGVEEVPPEETEKYGVIDPVATDTPGLWDVRGIVEKPRPEDAPSNVAVVGRYILTPRIFDLLEKQEAGAGGEIQLTDAIAQLLKEERVTAFEFKGERFDCGSKLGYLKATVEFALQHPELQDDFKAYLESRFG